MSLFWKDWIALKEAVKRHMFNDQMRFQGMIFEQSHPYLDAEISKMSVPDFERYVALHGLNPAVRGN